MSEKNAAKFRGNGIGINWLIRESRQGSPATRRIEIPLMKSSQPEIAQKAERRVEVTTRDKEILDALTKRVRVLTLSQIARTWWAESKFSTENAQARMQALALERLVQIQRVPAHPEIPLDAPAVVWNPGNPAPDFGSVAYRLQARWPQHPTATVCVSASRTAANRFSGHGGRFPRETERTHDIHLAQVYLRYRKLYPDDIQAWTFEEELRRQRGHRHERLPDVLLQRTDSQKVIEFGGAYPKEKLAAFHAYCKDRDLPYEIW